MGLRRSRCSQPTPSSAPDSGLNWEKRSTVGYYCQTNSNVTVLLILISLKRNLTAHQSLAWSKWKKRSQCAEPGGNSSAHSVEESSESEENQFIPTPIIEDFFERQPPLKQSDRFSLSALLVFENEIPPQVLEKALNSVVAKHGSLRNFVLV